VGYASLHLFRHVLHGSTKIFHVFEIASFLERSAADEAFWTEWRKLHAPGLRRLEAVVFALAEAWFGCALAPAAREEIAQLPASTRAWFGEFALSPATQLFHPNKDEIWLHLSLLERWCDRWSVLRRRLLPGNLPPPSRATESKSKQAVYAAWFAGRLRHHAVSLVRVVGSWWRWRRASRSWR